MWIGRLVYHPGQIVWKLTCPATGLAARPLSLLTGDLVSPQEVLGDGVLGPGAVAAAGGLGGLV
jgi:hypothetical protein